ncbi:MAG: RES family NAD+ phosphorylase [Acidobacteriaceae bacterium]|nr:RES family NAD+ phosphorylase [Acidobacteriaceae bacterium]MBV9679839.1 RES family NAD+ phosphorylase [Acidobacteriaceae bacterium]
MRVYRIASARYASNNSEGARLHGGRWNEVGTPVIYSSSSPSLAALEVLVHFQLVPADYRIINIVIPDELEIERIEATSLPINWYEEGSIPRTAAMGTFWARSLTTAVLRVPSAVVRSEYNYILNPLHPKFGEILFEVPAMDELDQRLRRKR